MTGPIDNNFRYLYQDPNINVNDNSHAATPRPFDINAPQKSDKTKKDFKKEKKKDKNGQEIEDDEEDEKKPLPRPLGL